LESRNGRKGNGRWLGLCINWDGVGRERNELKCRVGLELGVTEAAVAKSLMSHVKMWLNRAAPVEEVGFVTVEGDPLGLKP
jgi:hypothetical protein